MYRIRLLPPPLSVTFPPPSSTTWWLVFTTLAVAVMVIVTGLGPQSKVMMPPSATAWTTAAEVQPAGVPLPMTWSGWLVSTAWPASGTLAWPPGLPPATTAPAGPVLAVGAGRPAGEPLLRAAPSRAVAPRLPWRYPPSRKPPGRPGRRAEWPCSPGQRRGADSGLLLRRRPLLRPGRRPLPPAWSRPGDTVPAVA